MYVHAQLCPTLCNPWTVASQTPLYMEFSKQEYWSALPFPPPGDLFDLRIKPMSSALAGRFLTTESPGLIKSKLTFLVFLWHIM